jgi:hypothetical protein
MAFTVSLHLNPGNEDRTSLTRRSTSEEEEPDDHYFPLTLRTKKASDRPSSPLDSIPVNGSR